MTLAFS